MTFEEYEQKMQKNGYQTYESCRANILMIAHNMNDDVLSTSTTEAQIYSLRVLLKLAEKYNDAIAGRPIPEASYTE